MYKKGDNLISFLIVLDLQWLVWFCCDNRIKTTTFLAITGTLGLFKKQLFQAGTPANRFSHHMGQYKIGTKKNFEKKSHLGVAPAISIRYRSLKKKFFFDFFDFFSSQKIGKKSLIPTVYNNLGQIFLEMGQKRQNMLFLA